MVSAQRWDEAEEGRRREARELRAEVEARDEAICRLEGRVRAPLDSDPPLTPLVQPSRLGSPRSWRPCHFCFSAQGTHPLRTVVLIAFGENQTWNVSRSPDSMSMSFYGAKVFLFHVKLLLPLLSWPPRSRVLCVVQTPDPCL
jgi:hypothetical protein